MKTVRVILYSLFGKISWDFPPWLSYLKTNPIKILAFISCIMLVVVGAQYFAAPTNGDKIIAQVYPPNITPLEDVLTPQPLLITFGVEGEYGFYQKPVAPLSQIHKRVSSGIEMKPSIEGIWEWQNDSTLVFTPKEDWPAGQLYHVRFNQNIFTKHTDLLTNHYEFATADFEGEIADYRFYQDPIEPSVKKIVGTINFNYPVDGQCLQDHCHLIMQEMKKGRIDLKAENLALTFTFDKHYRTAYFQTSSLTLPSNPRYVNLFLNKDIRPTKGPAKITQDIKERLLLPDVNSFLRISDSLLSIERDENDTPFQQLTVTTSTPVWTKELAQYLSAYALPPNKTWYKSGEISEDVLAHATLIGLDALATEEHPATTHHFRLDVNANNVFINVAKGLPGFGGYFLANDYGNVLHVPEYPKELSFLYPGSLIALNSDKKLNLKCRGISTLKISIGQVLPEYINHLVSQTTGNLQKPIFCSGGFGRDHICHIQSEFQTLPTYSPSQVNYSTIDLKKYAGLGLFLIKVEAWDTDNDVPYGCESERLILITDLNIIVKDNADQSHDLFIQSISTGTPVSNAEVLLIGRNGQPIVSSHSDHDGHVKIQKSADSKPIAYIVKNDQDISLIPFQRADRHLNFSRYPIGGATDLQEDAIMAHLFSDRGLYRPGETVHMGGIVKKHFAKEAPSSLPLEAIIIDPRGHTVFAKNFFLPDYQCFALEYAIPKTALTGHYDIYVYIGTRQENSSPIGHESIQVAEYTPDSLTMQLDIPTYEGWIAPEDLYAHISLTNLFGTPAAQHLVKAQARLIPHEPYFSTYADYRFSYSNQEMPSKHHFEEWALTTDDTGCAECPFVMEQMDYPMMHLNLLAEGFERDGGRAVSVENSAIISSLQYFVGYKLNNNLSYLKQHSRQALHFIAINPHLESIALDDLHVQFVKIVPITTLVKIPDGTFAYQSQQQEVPLDSLAFAIEQSGSDLTVPTDIIGDFALLMRNDAGELVSKVYFSVVGGADNPDYQEGALVVKLDKQEYQAGETIEMQIATPFTGSGLITIERDSVLAYKWFQAETTHTLQTIELPKDLQGNGYVNVLFVRSLEAEEIYVPPLCYAVVPFSISHTEQDIPIHLDVPENATSGQTLALTYSTPHPAKLFLFAVDEGILQVADYSCPDPLSHFFCKQALTVKTQQIADLILPKYNPYLEVSAAGGSDGYVNHIARHLNPFKQKSEAPVIFWSGLLDSHEQEQSIAFQVPEYFNGKLRIMAVAASPTAVGCITKATEIQSDFIIQPRLPSFAAPEDHFLFSATITKNMQHEESLEPIKVKLTASSHLTVFDEITHELFLSPGEQQTIHFKMKANDQLGDGHVAIEVIQGEHRSQRDAYISIRPASAYQTTVISGHDQTAIKTIKANRELYEEQKSVDIIADRHPLALANGLDRLLSHYPFECTEQLVSKAFAKLYLEKDKELSEQSFKQVIKFLRERQNHDGSFCYWPGKQGYTSKLATVYAMDFLTEAQLKGFAVPKDVFTRGIQALKDIVSKDVHDIYEILIHAQAIYLLTYNGYITTPYLVNLRLNLDDDYDDSLVQLYFAATHLLMKDHQGAQNIMTSWTFDQRYTNDLFNPAAKQALMLVLLARHFPEHLKNQQKVLFEMTQGLTSDNLNTFAAANSIKALSSYADAFPLIDAPLEITKNTNNEILFHNSNKELFFYQITQSGYDKTISKPYSNGIEIAKTMDDIITMGDKTMVKICVRALQDRYLQDIAIVDLLPGGFEIVPGSICCDGCDHVDVREDRILIFCSLSPNMQEFSYQLRAINKGKYTVPPVYAEAMYNSKINALCMPRSIVVE